MQINIHNLQKVFTMKKLKHYIKEILLFLVVMTLFSNAISLYKSQNLHGEKIDLENKKLITMQTYTPPKGKPLLVHVWGSWCPVCKAEADNIERLSQYFEVITIAVNSGSDYEIHQYMQENNLHFKVINDKDGLLAKELNVAVYPTTFIYDKNHTLRFSEVGYTSSVGLFVRMFWSSF